MSFIQTVQNLTIDGSTVSNVSGGQYFLNNIVGPSSNAASNAPTIPAITSGNTAGSGAGVPLPPVNKKPLRPTTMFTGRQDVLQQIIRFFDGLQSTKARKMQKVFVLYSLGKTSIMMKFVEECSDRFSIVYYVDAGTLATLLAGFESIARNTSAGLTVDDALQWLSQHRNEWLLLLDNGDDPNLDHRQFSPHCRHDDIIVSSRNKAGRLYALYSNCSVSNMELYDATELPLKYAMAEYSDENRQLYATITRELGYLALAVMQAGAYISQSFCLDSYLQIHQTDRDVYSNHPLVRSWAEVRLSTAECDGGRMWAMQFLPFDESLEAYAFRRSLLPHVDAAHVSSMTTEIAEMFSLVYIDRGRRNDVEELLKFVSETGKMELGDDHPETLNSVNRLVVVMYNKKERRNKVGVGVLDSRKRLFADEHPDTLTNKHNLMSTYSGQGCLKEAEALQRVEANREVLGDEDPYTALNSKHNLASTYYRQGQLQKAETLEAQVLEAKRRVLGDEHPHTLSSQTNLACIYRDQGRLKEAAVLLSRRARGFWATIIPMLSQLSAVYPICPRQEQLSLRMHFAIPSPFCSETANKELTRDEIV